MAAFEVVQALSTKYDRVKEDLEISIADCVHKPCKNFTTWMEEAHENATTKGYSVMYREKILPALSQNKNFKNNSAAMNVVSEETKKKFMEKWKETKVDITAEEEAKSWRL